MNKDIIEILTGENHNQKQFAFESLKTADVTKDIEKMMVNSCSNIFLCLEYGFEAIVFAYKSHTPELVTNLPFQNISKDYIKKIFELYCIYDNLLEQKNILIVEGKKLAQIQADYEEYVKKIAQGLSNIESFDLSILENHSFDQVLLESLENDLLSTTNEIIEKENELLKLLH